MQIEIEYGIEGAKRARGITVIIDVYRAASTASYALAQGVRYIIPVSTKEEALALKKENPKYLLMGEEQGRLIDGFDLGNSPHEIIQKNPVGKILVHRTTQGTQGLVHAIHADELIFGSFPTASAIARYIKKKNPANVTIVAMDGKGSEDDVFAEYLNNLLLERVVDKKQVKNYLRNHEVSARFLDPTLTKFPAEDIDYCLDIDRFNFICIVEKKHNQLHVKKL